MKKTLTVLGVFAAVLAVALPATASNARYVASRSIQNNSVRSEDIRNGTIQPWDLSDNTKDKLRDHIEIVRMEQDFGPNGIGGAWCDDKSMVAISGGAQLSQEDVDHDVSVRSSWPYLRDASNKDDRNGWKVQLNAPANVDPGTVTVYAVCADVN